MAVGDKLEIVEFGGEKYQAIETQGECEGCEGLCSMNDCTTETRKDGKEIIWIRLEKEQSVEKPYTIKEIRAKTLTLQNEIYKLVEAFEVNTGMVVRGINLDHGFVINSVDRTYNIELDVRLN